MQAMKNHQEITEKDSSEDKQKNTENTEFINLDELFEENKNFSNNESFNNFQPNKLYKEFCFQVSKKGKDKLHLGLINQKNPRLLQKQVKLEQIDKKQSKKITRSQEEEKLDKQLFNAVSKNDTVKVRELVKKGADVNAKYVENGWTPLFFACWDDHFGIAQLLIELGADVNVQNDAGYTPEGIANWNLKIAKLLLESGANINFQSEVCGSSYTPLQWACCIKGVEMALLFVEYGADATFEDRDGETAIDFLKRLWSIEKLNKLCTYLLPVKEREVETEKQKNVRVFVEHNVIGAYTKQLQQGSIPLKVPEKDDAYKVTIIENREEIIKLCDKVMSFFFVPRIKPLVSTSMPNRELSEKQYRLALELFDCSKSAVLKVLTDHPEIRKQLGNLFKAMENANGKNKKRYFKDLNIRFYHDFDSRKFFKNVEK